MIAITDRARTRLEALLTARGARPDQGMKLYPGSPGMVRMSVTTAEAEDEVLRRGDSTLLIVDKRLASQLNGVVLDTGDGAEQNQFRLLPREEPA